MPLRLAPRHAGWAAATGAAALALAAFLVLAPVTAGQAAQVLAAASLLGLAAGFLLTR